MMSAILTRYEAPTRTRKTGRFVATIEGGDRAYFTRDFGLTTEENHLLVAQKLAAKLNWADELIGATIPGHMMVWIHPD